MPEKRVDLKVGFSCNNNCRFCVVADKRVKGDKTTEQIKRDLKASSDCGIQSVVFTGGEVTIRPDILSIVAYARDLEFKNIQIQTNGRMLAYMDFCKKLINAGATEFSPALHGHIPELHDYLTQSKGAFRQVIQGLRNLQKLEQRVITNTVITKPNYRYLPEISRLLIDCGVYQFQLAFVHANVNAWKNFDNIVPWKTLVKEYIYKAMDIAKETGTKAMVEAYPFCFMDGYEKYCSEFYIPSTELREQGLFDSDFEKTRKEDDKKKGPRCKECKYDLICEGPWKEYPEKRGWSEFRPVSGRKIKETKELFCSKDVGGKSNV